MSVTKRKSGLRFITAFYFLFIIGGAHAQLIRFEIRSLPPGHHLTSNVYLAGSFNNWNPQDKNYQFSQSSNGKYYFEVKLAPGSYEYKVTRGGWDKVESSKSGGAIQNRQLKVTGDEIVLLDVEEWQDRFSPKPRVNTSSKQVCILDTAFQIPQLNRARRVWIYLPADYCNNQEKYPVLYMHDGQNVFDDATSFSGEWGVDEFLDTAVLRKCIVVAVDHGGAQRLNEYNAYDNERFGKGEGDAYVDFLVNHLRRFINSNYRTKRDRDNTWIAGSSMGGLISLYAILKYPKVFGGAGIFSPAFWVAPGIFEAIKTKGNSVKGAIYFYAGKQESETMLPDLLKAFGQMAAVSKARMTTVIRDEGKHNEATWRKEFPLFYQWLLEQ